MTTLYVFIDESWNFHFHPDGTKYFLLTVLSTTTPTVIASPLLQLRYELLPNYACGQNVEEEGYFHASEDRQNVRDGVFSILSGLHDHLRIDVVIAQKSRTNPKLQQDEVRLYRVLGEAALKYVFGRVTPEKYENVVLVFSSIFNQHKRGVLKQAFKSLIKQQTGLPYALYFHGSKFDFCSQAADYFGWAIYRKWESGDLRSYKLIQNLVKSEFPIFERGWEEYYAYK